MKQLTVTVTLSNSYRSINSNFINTLEERRKQKWQGNQWLQEQ